MKLRNIVWTAVISAVSGLAGLVIALVGGDITTVTALAGIAIASAVLSQRER